MTDAPLFVTLFDPLAPSGLARYVTVLGTPRKQWTISVTARVGATWERAELQRLAEPDLWRQVETEDPAFHRECVNRGWAPR